MFSFEFNRCSV